MIANLIGHPSTLFWASKRPSFFIWKLFLKNLSQKPVSGIIKQLEYSDFNSLKTPSIIQKNGKLFFNRYKQQEILPNEKEELELVHLGKKFFIPHEVVRISAKGSAGTNFVLPIRHFGFKKAMGFKELYQSIKKLQIMARNKGEKCERIFIEHNHLGLEYIHVNDNKTSLVFNGLSHSDINAGQILFETFKIPLTLKAILDSGHFYQFEFQN